MPAMPRLPMPRLRGSAAALIAALASYRPMPHPPRRGSDGARADRAPRDAGAEGEASIRRARRRARRR
jgi:hypothetical protein